MGAARITFCLRWGARGIVLRVLNRADLPNAFTFPGVEERLDQLRVHAV